MSWMINQITSCDSLQDEPGQEPSCEPAQNVTANYSSQAASVVVTAVVENVDGIGVHVGWGQGNQGILPWEGIWGFQRTNLTVGDSVSLVIALACGSTEERLLLGFPDRPGQWAPKAQ